MSDGDATTSSAAQGAEPSAEGASDAALAERVAAVERAVANGDPSRSSDATAGDASLADRLDAATARIDDLHERLDELDAAVQALRGYASGVRAVDEEVERRADLALATARAAASGETAAEETAGGTAHDAEVDSELPGGNAAQRDSAVENRSVAAALPDQPAVAAAVPDATDTTPHGSGALGDGADAVADRPDGEGESGDDGPTDWIAPGVVDRLRDAL